MDIGFVAAPIASAMEIPEGGRGIRAHAAIYVENLTSMRSVGDVAMFGVELHEDSGGAASLNPTLGVSHVGAINARKNLKNCIIILDREVEQAENKVMTRPLTLMNPLLAALCAVLLMAPAHGDVLSSPAKYDFKTAVVTPETNRQATIDAAKFFDPAKPDCGIQAAIDALPPQGGEVVLPEGEFIIRKSLRLRSGVLLRGQGAKTILALPSPLVHAKLTQPIREGDTELVVDDASGFTPGMEISVTSAPTRMLAFFTRTTPDAKQLYLPYIQATPPRVWWRTMPFSLRMTPWP